MRITVEVDPREVLDGIPADKVVEHYEHHRDVDELLKEIGLSAIVRYLREHEPMFAILDEMANVDDVEAHIQECQLWNLKQKKEVG